MKKTVILLTLISGSLGCQHKMDYKKFNSEQSWFTTQLPSNWEEFDDREGTYLFYDAENWKGSLRITPVRWDNKKGIDTVPELLTEELKERSSEHATIVKLSDFDCVFYKEYVQEDAEELLIYNWMFGRDNTMFVISYTIDKEREITDSNSEELKHVENAIKTLQIK